MYSKKDSLRFVNIFLGLEYVEIFSLLGEGQLQVQAVASGGVHAIRVLHHDPHCTQHHPTHAQGQFQQFASDVIFYNEKIMVLVKNIS